MKKYRVLIIFTVIALLLTVSVAAAQTEDQRNFRASLKGRSEIPAVDTNAQGEAIFQLNPAGDELSFKLIVANIEGVTQAHIHCGSADVNGPVVLFLFGLDPAGVSVNGVLNEGTATAANVIPRPDSAACPGGVADFNDLVEKLRTGQAYANVHTLDNPGGEIRGQIH